MEAAGEAPEWQRIDGKRVVTIKSGQKIRVVNSSMLLHTLPAANESSYRMPRQSIKNTFLALFTLSRLINTNG